MSFRLIGFLSYGLNVNLVDFFEAVSSKMLHVFTPSLPLVSSQPSTSTNAEPSSIANAVPAYLENDDDVVVRSGSLSSTLQKLYLWEKKLYEEVKVS